MTIHSHLGKICGVIDGGVTDTPTLVEVVERLRLTELHQLCVEGAGHVRGRGMGGEGQSWVGSRGCVFSSPLSSSVAPASMA